MLNVGILSINLFLVPYFRMASVIWCILTRKKLIVLPGYRAVTVFELPSLTMILKRESCLFKLRNVMFLYILITLVVVTSTFLNSTGLNLLFAIQLHWKNFKH